MMIHKKIMSYNWSTSTSEASMNNNIHQISQVDDWATEVLLAQSQLAKQ